jgi:hypothetical protein
VAIIREFVDSDSDGDNDDDDDDDVTDNDSDGDGYCVKCYYRWGPGCL